MKDGPITTNQFKDDRNIIVYLNENEFRKKERALRKYLMRAYKYWIFDAVPILQRENKKDGKYELELPVDKLFEKVYGKVKILFTVENDIVIIEDIVPGDILSAMFSRELPSYKGIPYRNEKDKFKIELMKE